MILLGFGFVQNMKTYSLHWAQLEGIHQWRFPLNFLPHIISIYLNFPQFRILSQKLFSKILLMPIHECAVILSIRVFHLKVQYSYSVFYRDSLI